jgi:septal ring factor EnvC (AmiA/AmiB activator)
MKTSFILSAALSACFMTVSSSPIEVVDRSIEARQADEAYSIVDSLYTEIQQYTGAINATAASLNSESSLADNTTAAADYRTNVEAITAAVNAAKEKTDALSPESKLLRRQTDAALAALIENLLLEVSGALNNIIATLGLSKYLNPLRTENVTNIAQPHCLAL